MKRPSPQPRIPRLSLSGARLSMLLNAALSVAAMIVAAPVAADATDDAFIAALQRHAIPVANSEKAVATAHTVCSDISTGHTERSLVLPLARAAQLSAHEAGYFIGAAIAAYCPANSDGSDVGG